MDRVATWVLVGLLAYVSLILTSINEKLDGYAISGAEVAVLNEVKPQSYSAGDIEPASFGAAPRPEDPFLSAGFVVVAAIFIFITWHIARLYYNHQWTRRVMRGSFATCNEPHVRSAPREPIHQDQDCIADPPSSEGHIKLSWLPAHAQRGYRHWLERKTGGD